MYRVWSFWIVYILEGSWVCFLGLLFFFNKRYDLFLSFSPPFLYEPSVLAKVYIMFVMLAFCDWVILYVVVEIDQLCCVG